MLDGPAENLRSNQTLPTNRLTPNCYCKRATSQHACRPILATPCAPCCGSSEAARLVCAKRWVELWGAGTIKEILCRCGREDRHRIDDEPPAVYENGSSRTVRDPSSVMIRPAPGGAILSIPCRDLTSAPRGLSGCFPHCQVARHLHGRTLLRCRA